MKHYLVQIWSQFHGQKGRLAALVLDPLQLDACCRELIRWAQRCRLLLSVNCRNESRADAERRRLARKAQALGHQVLNELATVVTTHTLLQWYREPVASKWSYSHQRGPGRPRVMPTVVDLVVRSGRRSRRPKRQGRSRRIGFPHAASADAAHREYLGIGR